MDPGRFHHSPVVRWLWLGLPPLMLAAMTALALGYERLVQTRLDHAQAGLRVLPGLAAAQTRAQALLGPLRAQGHATAETEQLHSRVGALVRARGLVLDSLAVDRHEEQPVAPAVRLKVAISIEGSLDQQAALLAHLQQAEPLLVLEAGRWNWLSTDEEGEERYRGDLLLSLYRVLP